MDCNPPGSSVHGIPQARILEWGAISFTGDLPDPGIKPESLASLELTDGFFTTWEAFLSTWKWRLLSRVQPFATPWTMLSMEFSRPDTGVGSLSFFQGIFPAQASNLGLPHCGWILDQLSHKGSPRILEWVAYPFSRRFSLPRNRTLVSWIAEWFFTNWAIRVALTFSFLAWIYFPRPFFFFFFVFFKRTI